LKKRGRGSHGKKGNLQDCLKKAIRLNMPVTSGNDVAWRHESMAGLDVTAKWELLTRCNNPVPEPENADANLRPPTERNAALNPKYGFVETFDCILFTGTTESNIAARKAMH
jgi:hypothetical protein